MEGIKGVRDFGEYYVLIFRDSGNFSQIICQKDLLTNGTIEQFEELFDGKIVRKQSNLKHKCPEIYVTYQHILDIY